MADGVLKSFLVSIGFKTDETSQKKFVEGIAKAEKAVASLSLALAAAATAATAAAVKMAASFEDLFYASQRTGASITNLRGLAYAVSQLGGSYGGAVQSLEAFAKNIRTNPGYESMARKLGVATRENGKLRDTVDILTDLGKVFKKQDYYVAYQYATALGLDENTFRLLRDQPEALKRYRDEYEKTTRRVGLDSEEASRKSTELMRSLRSLQMSAQVVAEKLLTDFAPALTAIIEKLRAWIEQNPDQIRDWIEGAGKAAIALAAGFMKVVDAVGPLVTGLGTITSSITGKDGLQGGLEAFAVWLTTVWLVRILAAFTGVSTGWAAMLLRFGLNPAVLLAGAAALSGIATADQLPKAVARGGADPATGGALDTNPMGDIAKGNSGSLGRWWRRNMPTWLGGDPGGGTSSPTAANPDAAKALGEAIARTESGRDGYDTVLGNGAYGRPSKPLTQMTLAEVREFGRQVRSRHGSSSALGRYQIVNTTRDAAQRALGIQDSALYDAETQERMMRWIARNQGLGAWEGLKGNSREMAAARAAMAAGGALDGPPRANPAPKSPAALGPSTAQSQPAPSPQPAPDSTPKWVDPPVKWVDPPKRNFDRPLGTSAPLGAGPVDNSTTKTLNMPQNITVNVQGGDAKSTADATVRGLTRFQEMSLRNAQGAVR